LLSSHFVAQAFGPDIHVDGRYGIFWGEGGW
jgi:hypothetical protein